MIRYPITRAKLDAEITAKSATWFADTAAVLASLPANPAGSDFKPLWSKIKEVYIGLQHSKCCFCEKPLEGNIEQDVEHFRPKAEVKSWKKIPTELVAEGVVINQPADGSAEAGYTQLPYHPFNYAMSCKTCNSTFKGNLFPIEGTRDSANSDPGAMDGEKNLLIYPIGSIDADPESLIEFDALSPVPKKATGYGRRRALVTISLFRLDDAEKRKSLFKARATLVRLLYAELEGVANAATAAKKAKHQKVVDNLVSPETPFTNCLRSFKRLYESDPVRAEEISDECIKFMKTKSG